MKELNEPELSEQSEPLAVHCPYCKAEKTSEWNGLVKYACGTIGYESMGKYNKQCKGEKS